MKKNTSFGNNALGTSRIPGTSDTDSYIANQVRQQTQARWSLKKSISSSESELQKYFEMLGRYYAECLVDDESDASGRDIEMIFPAIWNIQEAIAASNGEMKIIEESLIENLINHEQEIFETGFENAKIKLQEELVYGEIGVIDYEFGIFNTNLWFENFDKIKSIRLLKREKQITWEEMETKINELLQINHD